MENNSPTPRLNYITLFGSMLLGGSMTLFLGKDLNWDLANYHYYNAYALLHFRYDQDFWPAGLNTYFNPTLDLLTYFLINYFPPRLTGFTLGAIQGITIWLTFRIALLFLPKEKSSGLLALLIAGLGMYCPQFICGIGMSLGDLTVGIFVLGAVYLAIFALKDYPTLHLISDHINYSNQKKVQKLIFLSGLLLGLGIGLKYIIGFYALGMAVAFLFAPISLKNKLFLIFMWGIALVLGITISAGYWMLFLWFKFHNPLFPFFNALFKSPYFPEINWRETRFIPKTAWETLFYPFYFSFHGSRTDDIPYIDIRFLITYVLIVISGVRYLVSKTKPTALAEKCFLIFSIISFIVWELFSGFMRYAIILEMLSPLVIYILINRLCQDAFLKFTLLFVTAYFIVFFMSTGVGERGSWKSNDYFGIKLPMEVKNIEKATVFLPIQHLNHFHQSPLSLAYLIPYFPTHWNFIGVPFATGSYNFINDEIRKKFLLANSKTYVLVEQKYLASFANLFHADITSNNCSPIPIAYGTRRETKIFLCQIGSVDN